MMQFPATNFHDLNLDWMLQQIKTMLTEWEEMQTDFSTLQGNFNGLQGNFNTLEAEWETEKTWMHNYVQTNLPVEVQSLFNAFIETPEFENLVTNAVSDTFVTQVVEAWLQDNISQETGYVLDSTLKLANAAAQSKEAGDSIRDMSVQYFPVNLAHGVGIFIGSTGRHKYINAQTGNLVNSTWADASNVIDLNGATRITYLRCFVTSSSVPQQGIAFYKTDDLPDPEVPGSNTYVSGVRCGYNAETLHFEFSTIDVPTYEDDNGDTQYCRYMRMTMAQALPNIPIVYNADDYEASLPGRVTTVETKVTTAESKINILDAHLKPLSFPAKFDFPVEVLHRGIATPGWPENAIVTYKNAIDLGWKWLETDLRRTLDGVWVLVHTDTISGSAGVARNPDGSVITGTVKVSESTYAELLQYDFGIKEGPQFAGTKVATLEELLILCKMTGAIPHIGIKDSEYGPYLESALQIADKYDMTWRSLWGCSSVGGIYPIRYIDKYKHVLTGGINKGYGDNWSGWSWVDPENFGTKTSAVLDYKTGENQVVYYWAHNYFPADETHTSIEIQDNFIDWCHYWGLLAGTYSPTTEAGFEHLSPRFDFVMGEGYHYTEIMTELIPTTNPTP